MNSKDLYRAINGVDDNTLERSESVIRKSKKKYGWMKWGAMAACLLLVIAVIFYAPRRTDSEQTIINIDAEETYPEVPGSLAKIYNSLLEIVNDADVIAYISVDSQSIKKLDGYPQIHTFVTIKDIYKGDLSDGDVMEVIEESGREGTVLGGIPLLNSKYEYILFLTEYNGSYYPVGAYQGRFILREGYLFQQAAKDVKLESYSPLSFSDFVSEIASLIGVPDNGTPPAE